MKLEPLPQVLVDLVGVPYEWTGSALPFDCVDYVARLLDELGLA